MLLQALCIILYPLRNSIWSYSPETPNLGQMRRFLEPCDLEIWWMTLKTNRAPLLCYFKLCSSFRSHWWIQTGVTVRKRPIWVKFDVLFTCVTLTFDLWPWLFAWTSLLSLEITPENFVMIQWWEHSQQGKSEGFDSCNRPSNLKLDSNRQFFRPCDREIWLMTLQNNRAPLLCYFKLCTSFRSHWWIQTWVTVRKHTPNLGQIWQFLEPCDLEIWQMTLQNNRAPLLCYFKLCASFCSHWWIQTSITVRKRPIWVKFDDF